MVQQEKGSETSKETPRGNQSHTQPDGAHPTAETMGL